MKIAKNEHGFTILELLASLVILSVIVGCLGTLIKIGLRGYEGGSVYSEIQENCRTGTEMIIADVKKCREITAVDNGSLTLMTQDGAAIRYYTYGNVLYRSINGTPNPTAMQVSVFRVQELYPDMLEISLITTAANHSYEITTRAAKR